MILEVVSCPLIGQDQLTPNCLVQDRGVRKERFLDLQDMAVADARMVDDSLEQFRKVLTSHSLGTKFRLGSLMRWLIELKIDLHDDDQAAVLRDPFHARLRRVAMNHILRDIKHHARIPLPRSHQLVGIADEGPAYVAAGYQNVFTLQGGQVYGQLSASSCIGYLWNGEQLASRIPAIQN